MIEHRRRHQRSLQLRRREAERHGAECHRDNERAPGAPARDDERDGRGKENRAEPARRLDVKPEIDADANADQHREPQRPALALGDQARADRMQEIARAAGTGEARRIVHRREIGIVRRHQRQFRASAGRRRSAALERVKGIEPSS